jgi:hypothetical protein
MRAAAEPTIAPPWKPPLGGQMGMEDDINAEDQRQADRKPAAERDGVAARRDRPIGNSAGTRARLLATMLAQQQHGANDCRKQHILLAQGIEASG